MLQREFKSCRRCFAGINLQKTVAVNMNDNYFVIEILFPPSANENIITFLSYYSEEVGFLEEDDKLICYIPEKDYTDSIKTELITFLNDIKKDFDVEEFNVNIEKIKNQNWNQEWESSIEPIEITDNIVIKPTWKEYAAKPNQIIIQIDPKMSFGTGHHESTRLTLWGLEKYLRKGNKMLDMGTGTGVLCIAAVFMGASSALGVDFDEWAYDNSLENVKINNVADKVRIIQGDLSATPAEKFDVITSNIDFKTNSKYIKNYPSYLAEQGVIVLSGILTTDEPSITALIEVNDMKVIDKKYENEWCCLIVTR
jgi:ribosomal protein L11 methyltransferase